MLRNTRIVMVGKDFFGQQERMPRIGLAGARMRSRVMLIAGGAVPNWSALIRMILAAIVCGCAYLGPVEAAQPLEDARAAYERGDYVEALRLFRLLADQHYAAAQNALGVMYQNGRGVPQDYAEAVKWYRKAAEQGYAHAQYNLGVMYSDGRGVSQDYIAAYIWLNLTASRLPPGGERDEAVKVRDIAAGKMTRAQLREAQRRARDWQPKSEQRPRCQISGECWVNLSARDKRIYVDGIYSGQAFQQTQGERYLYSKYREGRLPYPYIEPDNLLVYFDELYSTPENRPINYASAYDLAVRKGWSSPEELSSLTKLYREGRKPLLAGYLRGFITPNKVVISSKSEGEGDLFGMREERQTITMLGLSSQTSNPNLGAFMEALINIRRCHNLVPRKDYKKQIRVESLAEGTKEKWEEEKKFDETLLHERPVALHAVAHWVRDWLGNLADQHVVGSWGGAGADTEQCSERGMPCSAPIEAEDELVEVVLEVGPPQSVVDAQAPALEV